MVSSFVVHKLNEGKNCPKAEKFCNLVSNFCVAQTYLVQQALVVQVLGTLTSTPYCAVSFHYSALKTMIHPIFPSSKPRFEWALWLLGAFAVVLCLMLQDYSFYRPLPTGFPSRLDSFTDSVLTSVGLTRDSVEIMAESSVDEPMLRTIQQHYGAKAPEFLRTRDVQQNLYRVKIRKQESGIGIQFVSGNRSRPSAKKKTSTDETHVRTLWLNADLSVVGEVRTVREPMPRDTNAAKSLGVGYDTNAVQNIILRTIPENPVTRSLHKGNLNWKRDTAFPDAIGFVALVSADTLWHEEWMIRATKTSDKPEEWTTEWIHRFVLHSPTEPAVENGITAKQIFTFVFWGMIIIGLLWLGFVYLSRVRMKAVSLWLLLIAPLVGLGWTISYVPVSMKWYGYVILWLIQTLGFGLFFAAVPFSALMAVLLEIASEKFYTLKRLRDAPWRSFHLGRMLLAGVSIGAIYTALSLLVPFAAERWGFDVMSNGYWSPESYMVPFLSRNLVGSFIFSTTYVPLIALIISVSPIVLAYRFLPRALQFWGMLFGLIVFLGIFAAIQSFQLGYVLLQGVAFAIPVALLFLYYDAVALIVFTSFSTLLLGLPLFQVSSWGIAIPLGTILLVVAFGFIAYRNEPERVSEADYKPEFLSLIEENERLHQEIAAAKSVQQKLLPRHLPTIERVRVSAACIPAYEVGGDYYDFFPLDDKRLGVLIGDVSGKGISAAFYITLAKGVIVSQVRGVGSPSDVLHRVNALLYGVMERGKFVSMIYGIYDTSTREFSFANAGHNPLVVLRREGEVQTVAAKGMAIGLDKGERFEKAVSTMSVQLNDGDCVLLYTDGVTEAMNTDHAEYGEERMIAALKTSPLNAADIISTALADVRKFAGKAHQHDDITLVALEAV